MFKPLREMRDIGFCATCLRQKVSVGFTYVGPWLVPQCFSCARKAPPG